MKSNANVKMVGMTEEQRTDFIIKAANAGNELCQHIDSENTKESLIIIATSKVDEGNQVLSCIVGSHEALVSGLVDFIEKYHSVFKDAVEILAARKMASLITSLGNSLDMPKDEKQ